MNSKSGNGFSQERSSASLPVLENICGKRDQLVIPTTKRCAGVALGDESEEFIVHSGQKQQSKGMDHRIKTQG